MLGNCVFKGSTDIFTCLFLQALSMLVTYLMQYYFLPCRIESYSCKMAGDDKHMFKQFCQEGEPHVLEALSPPQSTSATSPSQWVVQLRSRALLHQDLSSKFRRDNVEFPFPLYTVQAGEEQWGWGEPSEWQVLQEDSFLPYHDTQWVLQARLRLQCGTGPRVQPRAQPQLG